MKKASFKVKVLFVMSLILVLVTIAGFLAYNQFSKIVKDISDAGKPDKNLLTVKELLADLREADDYVKSFTITQDAEFVDNYKESEKKVYASLMKVNLKIGKHSSHVDGLETLIDAKFKILDELLELQNAYRVKDALDEVSNSIDNVDVQVQKKRKLQSFLSKKEVKEEELINVKDVYAELEGLRLSKESQEQELLDKEFELLLQNKKVTAEIVDIIRDFELFALEQIDETAHEAGELVDRTNRQLAIFCVSICLLLLFMAYTIFNYVRNNNKYKRALKLARIEAERLVRTKERFVATVSHEIRTPMNLIAGFTEQISQEKLSKNQREQLKIVQKATDHLLNLVNDVLDLTKLDSRKMKLDRTGFRMNEIIKEVVQLTKPLTLSKELEISFSLDSNVPAVVIGDPFRLRQILLNIIGNAIKFTDKGTVDIHVSAPLQNKETTHIRIVVSDTGIGMSESQQELVFQEFEQAESNTTKKYGGTGLGLTITQKLVKLHDGTITTESELNKGTKVFIEIPYGIGSERDILPENSLSLSGAVDLSKMRILIVDDEIFNRKLLSTIFKKYDAIVTEAENGLIAIQEVEKNDYDLILMDIRMPELNGIEATQKIRNELAPEKRSIPIIALSAGVSENDQKKYKKAKMNGFIAKPFKEYELIESIMTILELVPTDVEMTRPNLEDLDADSLDFAELKSIGNGDEVFYKEMLQTFVSGTEDGIVQMHTAFQEEEYEKMADLAHKICAPCNHLGATKLYELLKQVELAGRDLESLDIAALASVLEEISTESQIVIAKVKSEIQLIEDKV